MGNTVEGYRNYPTMATKLWLDNDERLYNMVEEMADEAYSSTDEDDDDEDRVEASSEILARQLEEWFDEVVEEKGIEGLLHDLLTFASQDIDWKEIARDAIEYRN